VFGWDRRIRRRRCTAYCNPNEYCHTGTDINGYGYPDRITDSD